jgi:hypothetical protein
MALVKKTPTPFPGACLAMPTMCGFLRDKINVDIIHRIRSFPSDPCHTNGLQAIKKNKYLQDMQR